jgi:amidase
MDRRDFIRSAAALGGAAVAGGATPALVLAAPPAVRVAGNDPVDFELNEVTLADLQRAMREGRHTARSIAVLYLQRIDAVDRVGPTLRSVLELNPDALRIADAMDAERQAGNVRGPLHGIPILLKDVIDTADGMHTTAGSLALMGSLPPRDAFIVSRLRDAGAVILGKTNLSEWSNARSTNATSGWSARGGLSRNPYILDRTACGSSSGTGAAISANLAAVGLGVETDGSIACPASANCLVGIKPTVGLWSRAGLIPISYSQDTAGPMTRTVTDAAILLGVLTGSDPRDLATEAAVGHALADYTAALDRNALRGARIGVLRRQHLPDTPMDRLLSQAVEVMRSAGATIVDEVEITSIDELQRPEVLVLLCEFKDGIRDYLLDRGPEEKHRSLADLIRFNREHADVELEWFGQEWFEAAETTNGRGTPDYRAALARCRTLSRIQGLDRVLGELQLDAIVSLAAGPPFSADLINGDRPVVSDSSLSAVAGYPRVTLPAGFVHDLPVGISFMGGAWSEARLLGLAYAFEQLTQVRRPPRFLPTAVTDK